MRNQNTKESKNNLRLTTHNMEPKPKQNNVTKIIKKRKLKKTQNPRSFHKHLDIQHVVLMSAEWGWTARSSACIIKTSSFKSQ